MPSRIRRRKFIKKPRFTRKARLRKNRRRVPVRATAPRWGERAYAAGRYAAAMNPAVDQTELHHRINQLWNGWYASIPHIPWPLYHATATRFIEGYCQQSGQYASNWVLLPTDKSVSAIITAMNEKDTIPSILEQLHRLPLHEIIFVLNGSNDESFEIIRNQSSATIAHFHDPLGHDVGRAIGAKLSESEILLFLDGDFPIFAEHLVPFIDGVERGMDIVLNNISPYIGLFSKRDKVTMVKEFLNMSMEHVDLAANSLTAIPHAMTRVAVEKIGYKNLSTPPKAQVIALSKGLKVGAPTQVDVISNNRLRNKNVGSNNSVAELIIGDHIEALKQAMEWKGSRLSYPDLIRDRQKAN